MSGGGGEAEREPTPGGEDLDLAGIELCPLHRRLDGVRAESCPVRHVEGATPGFREPRAGGGDDHGFGHAGVPCFRLLDVRHA